MKEEVLLLEEIKKELGNMIVPDEAPVSSRVPVGAQPFFSIADCPELKKIYVLMSDAACKYGIESSMLTMQQAAAGDSRRSGVPNPVEVTVGDHIAVCYLREKYKALQALFWGSLYVTFAEALEGLSKEDWAKELAVCPNWDVVLFWASVDSGEDVGAEEGASENAT